MAKKVLIIENSLYKTGALIAAVNMAERLRENGYDFVFIVPQQSIIADFITNKGFSLYKLPFIEVSKNLTLLKYFPTLLSNAKKIIKIIEKEKITILHINDVYNMVGCMVKILRPKTRLVYHVRLLKTSYIAPLYSIFSRVVRKYADAIICVSDAVKQHFGNCTKSTVIYDAPIINEKYDRWNGLKSPQDLSILYLGNYVRGKGQDYGLEALKIINNEFPNVRLKFVGTANDKLARDFKKELQRKADDYGLSQNILFADKVDDVEKEMKMHDLVLNLSESESFSFVCLEALLYGIPLIASDSGGPAEITNDGEMATLVKNKDPYAAAAAIKDSIENSERACIKARQAKAWAREKFDPQLSVAQFDEVYSGIL